MAGTEFIDVAGSLDSAGLIWLPEVGDEVSVRDDPGRISILVDPHSLPTDELRCQYLWLPTIEQLVFQIEARQGILFHTGLDLNQSGLTYKTVVQIKQAQIESRGVTMRSSLGLALKDILVLKNSPHGFH